MYNSGTVFNINNATGRNRRLCNKSVTETVSSTYINELKSILEDTNVVSTISKDLYKGIDKSNKNIIETSEEFYKFYNKTNKKIREMTSYLISNAVNTSNIVSSTISRSTNNIQKYLDHINKKPFDYEYRTISFKYTFNKELPIISDIIEIGKDVDVNTDTNLSERYNNHDTRISNGSHMNLVRGSISGMYGVEITMDEFRDVLYRSYRNGSDEASSVLFTKKDLVDSCSTLLSHLGSGQTIVDTAERIERETIAVLDKIVELNKSDFVSELESEDITIYYSYLYNKLIELVEVFTMVRLAFTIQLEAYSESYLGRLDIIRSHYDSGGIVTPPSNILESINHIFFITEMEEQRNRTSRLISESMALSLEETGHITTNLRIINEDYASSTKSALGRLMNRIKNLWDKFMEKVNNLIKTDEKYLKKYKKIILDRDMEKGTYEMYDFSKGAKVMQQATVPAFNYASLRESLETEESFIDAKFANYSKKDKSFTEGCKLVFRGSDEKISFDTGSLDIQEMYNFCIGYNKSVQSIKTDMSNIEKAGNEAIKIVDAISVNTESVVYSSLRRTVIYEDDSPTVTKGKTKEEPNKSNEREADGRARAKNDDDKSSDIDRIMNYMKVTQNFLGCKMTVMQEIYKGYMFIIREHVKGYTGTRDTSKPDKPGSKDMKNVESDEKDSKNIKANFLS